LRGQSLPPILIGQLTNRQYHYDALSQLIAVQMPEQTLGYGYDAAGRLRSQARYDSSAWLRAVGGKLEPQTLQRWDIDPAGNRLPGKITTDQQQQQSWGQQVHRRWQEPEFNLLGQGSAPKQQPGKVDQWPGNRIGFTEDSAWRYDSQGNRVEQMREHGNGQYSRQQLFYDGANQLTAVQVDGTDGQGGSAMLSTTGYIYDALGRRLKKSSKDQNGKTHITYFGWDGDRQVHTETLREDGDRDIMHTVYEPGTFTPMVRLSTKAKGQHQAKPPLMVQAGLAGLPPEMMSGIPGQAQKDIESIMRQVLTGPLTPMSRRIMGNMGINPEAMIGKMRGKVEEIKQAERTPVTVHYFHCDHLGTPLALTDQQGNIAWAVKYDPWGNIEEEFNPSDIEQNIRLPGQYCDRETGLYYNHHRYYDPKVGAYINQDPIGLFGGINLSKYTDNPVLQIDPLGLSGISKVFDGPGDTSVCSYYDAMSKANPNCGYYPKAAEICKGKNTLVNAAIDSGIIDAYIHGNTQIRESQVLDKIRNSLIASDKEARAAGQIGSCGCVKGNVIDAYHNKAFESAGINKHFYGGNMWFQGVWPDPVPFDPDGKWKYDPRK
jgi:RHS repeat-associated protein